MAALLLPTKYSILARQGDGGPKWRFFFGLQQRLQACTRADPVAVLCVAPVRA